MAIEEDWQEFREHMGIPDASVPRACFYAGYTNGAHAIHEAAHEACQEIRVEFRARIVEEVAAERLDSIPPGAKPS